MPEVAGIAQADRLAVLHHVRHHKDLRMARQLELVQHVDLQRAEAAAEGDLLRRRDALVAEHQHVIVEVRAMDAREIPGGQRLRQIQPDHFGTERCVERTDAEAIRASGACGT
jgi:hypothetical protein